MLRVPNGATQRTAESSVASTTRRKLLSASRLSLQATPCLDEKIWARVCQACKVSSHPQPQHVALQPGSEVVLTALCRPSMTGRRAAAVIPIAKSAICAGGLGQQQLLWLQGFFCPCPPSSGRL